MIRLLSGLPVLALRDILPRHLVGKYLGASVGRSMIGGFAGFLGESLPMRRFPRPWTVEPIDGGFDAEITKSMTLDEARRVVANITKLPTFLAAQPFHE